MSESKVGNEEKGINILSLDAGSPGGALSQIYILAEFMRRLRNRLSKDEELLPADVFDLIGGSGLGAFVALCIGSLRMNIDDTIDALCLLAVSVFYEDSEKQGKTIFSSQRLRDTVTGIIERSGHSPEAMISTLSENSNCKTVLFVSPVVDIGSCHRLRTYRGRKGMLQCSIIDVLMASISTSGLFEHAEITSRRLKYTSAGMHHTNPIMTLLDEVEQIYGPERRVSCILSLGAGTSSKKSMPSNLSLLEIHGLLQAMEIQQQTATINAEHWFGNLEAYFRFSVTKGVGSSSLQDWIHWESEAIETRVREYLEYGARSNELDAAVGCSVDGKGTVTLNRLNHASGVTVVAKTVPPVAQFFVLRKKSWKFIERNLVPSPSNRLTIFILSGMGGCGKSTILSYYVQVYGSKYSHIFLIDATSIQTIKTDLQNAVRSLGPEHSQKTWEEALQYFRQDGPNKNWLIGFDNADDPSISLQDYIPDSEHGTIFITTRNRDLCFLTSGNLHWELGPMTEDEALDALLQSAQRSMSPSENDLRDGAVLTERLGRLALALIQAGVYCFQKSRMGDGNDVPFTFRQYIGEMEENQAALMRYSAAQSLDRYRKSVYAALNMSYLALPELTREFLHLCGFFHHSNIPLLMLESAVDNRFQQCLGHLPTQNEVGVENKLSALLQVPGKSTTIHLHKIIFSLKMFSLVVTSTSPISVMLNYHTLVNAFSRDTLPAPQKNLYSSMATRVLSACAEGKYYTVHSSLVSHIQEALKRSTELDLNDMAAFAGRLTDGGIASEGEALYRKLYDRCTREFGVGHKNTLMVLGSLTHSIKNQGRVEEAEKIEREMLKRMKSIYAEDDQQIFFTESNLTTSYIEQERWAEADTILQKLVVTAKRNFGNEHPHTLTVMHNAAWSYFGQARHRDAMVVQEEVLEARKRVLGKDHPDTLQTINNLANSYAALNRLDDAERLAEEGLEIKIRMIGKDHPDTLMAVRNLAFMYRLQEKFDKALTLADQALEGYKRVVDKRHPEKLRATVVLADLYFAMGRLSDGVILQEELRELEGVGGKFSTLLLEVLTRRGLA